MNVADGLESTFRCCVLIPTFNNPQTIERVVREARKALSDVVVIDDGSGEAGRVACERLAEDGRAHVHRRARNGGKGAAVKTGFAVARELGFTHVLQVDADGQHDLSAIPEFLAVGKAEPRSLVLGFPEYDASAPTVRKVARRFTRLWVDLEAGAGVIADSMIGFRLYPLAAVEGVHVRGDRMDFDIEIAVRLAWTGMRIVNRPVRVRYLGAEEGGISHFQLLRDNLRFAWLHSRLCTHLCTFWCLRKLGLVRPRLPA